MAKDYRQLSLYNRLRIEEGVVALWPLESLGYVRFVGHELEPRLDGNSFGDVDYEWNGWQLIT